MVWIVRIWDYLDIVDEILLVADSSWIAGNTKPMKWIENVQTGFF